MNIAQRIHHLYIVYSGQSLDPNSPRVDVNSREIHRTLLPYLTLVEHACYLHTRQPPHCHQTRAAPLLPASNEASQFIRFSLVLKRSLASDLRTSLLSGSNAPPHVPLPPYYLARNIEAYIAPELRRPQLHALQLRIKISKPSRVISFNSSE